MSSFSHTRDARDIRTRVVVKGIGTDGGLLVYAIYSAHASAFPTKYQVDAGWSGEPFSDSRIDTRAKALTVATTLGERLWGPKGTIKWRTSKAGLQEGDIIELTDPYEGQAHAKKIIRELTEVGGQVGRRLWEIMVGDAPVDIMDLISRASTTRVLSDPGRTAGGGAGDLTGAALGATGTVGTPKQVPLERVPTHSQRNTVTPRFKSVTGQRFQATTNTDPVGTPPVAHLVQNLDPAGRVRNWASGTDGTDHPHHYTFPVPAAGTVPFVIPDPAALVTEKILNLDGTDASGDVTTSYLLNGASAANPTVLAPLVVARYDVLQITFAGTFPTGGVAFLVSEAPPL